MQHNYEAEGLRRVRYVLPEATKAVWVDAACHAVGYAYEQTHGKQDRFEDVFGWAQLECYRHMYQSNDPPLYRQIFLDSFERVYHSAKQAFEDGRYAIAPNLDRATRMWLFSDWAVVRYRELASSQAS